MLRSITLEMNKYLALILGFSVLTVPSVAAVALPAQLLQVGQEGSPQTDVPQSGSPQRASQDTPPAAQESPQAGSEKAGSEQPPSQAAPTPDTAGQSHKAQPEAAAKKHRRRKHAAAGTSASTPEKKVVRNGGTDDPAVQLAPGVSDEQASRQRQSTTQLLAATDTKLKQISARQLSPSQQESVSQIRKYMEQAKAAEAAGDVQRAQNLASKALLLSDDLVKH